MSVVAKWLVDQDTTWYGGRPRPRWHCVRWGPCFPTERGTAAAPHFLTHFALAQFPIWATAELVLQTRWSSSHPIRSAKAPKENSEMLTAWSRHSFTAVVLRFGALHLLHWLCIASAVQCNSKAAVKIYNTSLNKHERSKSLVLYQWIKTCKPVYHHHTTNILRPFFQDHPGEPVPEENFWTL